MKLWQPTALALLVSTSVNAADKTDANKWDVNHPQGEFKTAQINTKTGTWMNIDVSPDGKNIAFDLLGDIYVMPIQGGTPKRLTADIGWQMQPSFSPDGRYITYTSDEGGGDTSGRAGA